MDSPTRALSTAHTPNRRTSFIPPRAPGSKRKFPVQSNTLLSWVQATPRRVLSSSALQPAAQASSSPDICHIASPSPCPQRPCLPSGPSAQPSPSPNPQPLPIVDPSYEAAHNRSPGHTTSRISSPQRAPTETTAYELAKQLRRFQGCTHEEHDEAERLHQLYHLQPNVHSACSSLQQVTSLIRGDFEGGTPLPDVLAEKELMKRVDLPSGLDLAAAFEGKSTTAFPEDAGTPNDGLPRTLCLSQSSQRSKKGRAAKTSFDIDSICCYPSSLGFARQGINWFPVSHAFLNLSHDIHFSLKVAAYNNRGNLTTRNLPLHKVPHTCFGSAIGMESLFIYIFFPELHMESQYQHSTYLSAQDQQLWTDAVLMPALVKTVGEANVLQHYPTSAHVAKLDASALSTESFARKDTAREQLLKHTIQPHYLEPLWTRIVEAIAENPGLERFHNARLFVHAKNTKLEYMGPTLTTTYDRWKRCWAQVADAEFYSQDRTYVDIAKQVTSEDSALPYDPIPDNCEAEVYLWKRCCLEAYARTRELRLPDGKRAKGSPRCMKYPWATMRDTMGQTLFAAPGGQENLDGLIYSQCYGLVKTPFDTSKTYVFSHDSLENLALDPGYIQSLQRQGGGITFSKKVCERAYLHSKARSHGNLVDNRWKSYGIREEHRVSLTMMAQVCAQWREWDAEGEGDVAASPSLPYYVVPTQELFGFIYAQMNKYCFLFEHTLAHTARTYSLPETIVMVIALRALRFCYGSNILALESLLYKSRWETMRGAEMVVKEGMGMQETMERCGLGWFLPKFNWTTRRLNPPHGDNVLVGNLLMHAEYKRRWQAVKDLRDVFVRFNQADGWYDRYNMSHNPGLLEKWLEYLHALNVQQFDADVWAAMLAAHKSKPELSPKTRQHNGPASYCYRDMKDAFIIDGVITPPHLVTGNKMRFEKASDLLDFLFLWDDNQSRAGWACKPYRLIIQKSFELIEQRLGDQRASQWLDEFLHLIRLTHWILPYPSNAALISHTKASAKQNLTRRMMWFSAVYAHPGLVVLPFKSMPKTLYTVIWRARRQQGEDPHSEKEWSTLQLIQACRTQGIKVYGQDEGSEYWIAGRRSTGSKGFQPVWERSRVPKLQMLEQIRDKSMDELEELMMGMVQEHAEMREVVVGRGDAGGRSAAGSARRTLSIRDVFSQVSSVGGSREGIGMESTGSVFVPSLAS